MPLQEKIKSGNFVVLGEFEPPKGADFSSLLRNANLVRGRVDAFLIPEMANAVLKASSLGACAFLEKEGIETVLQVCCRDRNRLALQAELLLAYSRDITNVLCLTGDSVDVGDHKDAKPVFDLDSVQLIKVLRTLESGVDMGGNELGAAPKFCIGTSVHPEADFIEPQLIKFDKKVSAGAQFFQTQGIFDLASLRRFMQYASQFDVKILAGIIVLSSAGMAKYMNKNVPGIIIDQALIDEMAAVEKGKGLEKGIEIAARFIKTIREENLCHGVHIMAVGNEGIVPDILEAAELVSATR